MNMPMDASQYLNEVITNPSSSAVAAYQQANDPAFNYQVNQGGLMNFITGQDPEAHNAGVDNWKREQVSAQKANEEAWRVRDWEAYREDNQFRRKVQDYLSAGFSPLAAMEGSGSYGGGSSAQVFSSHSQQANPRNTGSFGGFLGSIVGALALIASKGMATSAQAAKTATETAAKAEIAEKAAAAKMAAAETSAQAKVDTARILKFGDDLHKLGDVDNASLASAFKAKTRKELLGDAPFKAPPKVPDIEFTAAEAAEARKLGMSIPRDWIRKGRKK